MVSPTGCDSHQPFLTACVLVCPAQGLRKGRCPPCPWPPRTSLFFCGWVGSCGLARFRVLSFVRALRALLVCRSLAAGRLCPHFRKGSHAGKCSCSSACLGHVLRFSVWRSRRSRLALLSPFVVWRRPRLRVSICGSSSALCPALVGALWCGLLCAPLWRLVWCVGARLRCSLAWALRRLGRRLGLALRDPLRLGHLASGANPDVS
jgi:hypothetical protein